MLTSKETFTPKREVRNFMTRTPLTIDARKTLEEALAWMEREDIRHLPVEHEGHIIGILSERDISRAFADELHLAHTVEDAMTREPFTVAPDADLADVVSVMAVNRIGCALVKGPGGKLAGIFTVTDALNAFVRYLRDSE